MMSDDSCHHAAPAWGEKRKGPTQRPVFIPTGPPDAGLVLEFFVASTFSCWASARPTIAGDALCDLYRRIVAKRQAAQLAGYSARNRV
jgi:hypothetical protein